MKKLALLSLAFLSAMHVRADLVIVQKMDMDGKSQELTMKVKGDKMRTDLGEQLSTITDLSNGNVTTMIPAQKKYIVMSAETTKAQIEQMAAAKGQPEGDIKITDTGKSEKVGDYKCEIYTAETPSAKFTFWVTKDFPNYATLQAQFKKIQDSMKKNLGEKAMKSAPDTTTLDGVPVKTVVVMDGKTVTTSLVSAKEESVPDSTMQVPSDYTDIKAAAPSAQP